MRFLLALSMFALLAGGTWQVFTRLVLNRPSTVTDEFLRYVLIWSSMIGSAYCFYKDEHLALNLITDKVKGLPAVFLQIFIELCILFFVCYVFLWGGAKLALNALNVSSVMHLPYSFLYSVFPVSGILIVLARVMKYIRILSARSDQKEKGGTV